MNITATLIIQVLAFIVLIILINKFMWQPLSNMMAARQKRIEDGLTAAERSRVASEESKREAEVIIKQSHTQAAEILANAHKQAGSIVDQAKTQAKQEAEQIKTHAQNEIQQEFNRAKTKLQSSVSALALQGARQILRREIDAQAHSDMLSELSKSL